ncbi:MAG: tetratricopeptide repeat protein [Polyangia bacterium]
MRRIWTRITLSSLLLCSLAVACGGSQKKKDETAAGAEQPAVPGEPDSYDVPQGGDDQSTGDAVPTGPGEQAPEEHQMSADARGTYNDGVRAAAEGNLDRARQSFERTLQIDPRAHQALYNLGVIADRKGDEEGSRSYYRQALAAQPNYLPAIRALSNLEVRRGNVDAAVGMMRDLVGRYPKDIGILNQYAEVLIVASRYKDAIDVAKQALRVDERNAEAMLRVGKANLRLGRTELAEAVFENVLSINPDEAEVFFLRSFIYLERGHKVEAINSLKKTLEKRPTHVEAMNNLAVQYILSGNYEEAIAQLEKALELAPSWGVLHLNHGNALRGAGRWQEAKQELERARQLDPSLTGVLFNKAILYYVAEGLDDLERLERYKKAKRLFADYKAEMGSALEKDDPVHDYLKELDRVIDREERRLEQIAEREKREAERAAAREAEGDAGAADEGWEDEGGEDEGWEDEGWE